MTSDNNTIDVNQYLDAKPLNAEQAFSAESARANAEKLEAELDLPETQMYQERALEVDGPNGTIPLRIYWPRKLERDEKLPIVLFIHGGAWVFCSMDTHENMFRYLCNKGDVIGVNVGYRLAPEHKFPQGIEDCYAALEWIETNAEALGADRDKICVGGDSAGGNISAVLALLARDRKGPDLSAQLLFYPSTSLGVLPRHPSYDEQSPEERAVTEKEAEVLAEQYLNDHSEITDFRVSPILADSHSGLPKTLIITGQIDPVRDDGFFYGEKLAESGVEIDYKCYEGAPHAFMSLAGGIPLGYEALNYTASFLQKLRG